jgi:acetylornithine deacetylase
MQALDYTKEMVAFDSTSRVSNVDVSDYVEHALRKLEFDIERIEYDDDNGVRKANVVGKKGSGKGGVAYFGHTDVVPADDWAFPDSGAFEPAENDGRLYGRGSCDMKGSVACMLAAVEQLSGRTLREPIYVTCTADEEVGYGGANQLVARSELYREIVADQSRGIIGEPTRLKVVHAHKGGIVMTATSHGRASHSSTREGLNANLAMIPFLAEMKEIHDETESNPSWQNNEFDPPTVSFNIGINDFTYAVNITPPKSVSSVYFRPMPGTDSEALIQRVQQAADKFGIELIVRRYGEPMYIESSSPFIQEMLQLTDNESARTVSYGTDGGVFTDMKKLVVFGPGDIAQAHTVDEWIELEQLEKGTSAYAKLIENWCC